ncbi:MAG: hypothetical protein ACT4PV_16395 [Planctomycetaceae bacterium]
MLRFPFLLLLCAGCAAYRSRLVTLPAVAAEVERRTVGRLDFAAAAAFALEHHHEVLRLEAEARAAGLDIPASAGELSSNLDEENVEARVDPLALVRIGPRGAAARVARARLEELAARLRQEKQTLLAAIAETFLVERVLRTCGPPSIDLDAEPFERAGLASRSGAAQARAARAARAAEGRANDAERRSNLAYFRHLLGLDRDAPVDLALPDEEFPPLPAASRENLLRRPDLAVALASYKVADAEFRQAVADQYPSLSLGSEISWTGGGVAGLVGVRVPLGASRPARAAGERREAARIGVEAALLIAQQDAVEAEEAYESGTARARAAALGAQGMATMYQAAATRLELEPDGFEMAADVAVRAVADAVMAREAAVAAARARVRRARAYGWPFPEELQ